MTDDSDIINPADKDLFSYQHSMISAVILVHAKGWVVGIRLRDVFDGRDGRGDKDRIHWISYGL